MVRGFIRFYSANILLIELEISNNSCDVQ